MKTPGHPGCIVRCYLTASCSTANTHSSRVTSPIEALHPAVNRGSVPHQTADHAAMRTPRLPTLCSVPRLIIVLYAFCVFVRGLIILYHDQ